MEVMAVIRALEAVEKGTRIQLFSDSQYVIKTMSGMFRKKKNTDLWRRLDRLVEDSVSIGTGFEDMMEIYIMNDVIRYVRKPWKMQS